ncbi:MAG: ABC transporter ATP-binding protein [Chloroflexi bacterium]|nr:ABC transporter ATP-binding protein [Chloroflexota bacterium]
MTPDFVVSAQSNEAVSASPLGASPRAEPLALEASNISVVLGGWKVLEVPSLQVIPNEVMVVIGPNGSGKTTLLLTLAGLLRPASGTILYQGQAVQGKAETLRLHRRLAVVFQEPLLLNANVWENVTLGLRFRGVDKEEIKSRANRWLERFGIASLAGRQARTLSGGEAKRTSLARAFALQPDILFLDEAFNGLDSHSRQSIIKNFGDVLGETKVTTIMVTHDSNEALALAHRVTVVMDGHIRQIGSCEDVFSNPVDEQVATFVGVENIIDGVIVSNEDKVVGIDIRGKVIEAISDYAVGEEVSACIRPEDVTLALLKVTSSARNSFVGEVSRVVSTGPLARVEIDCGFRLVCLVTKKSAEELDFKKGKPVYATFKATAVHVIKRASS